MPVDWSKMKSSQLIDFIKKNLKPIVITSLLLIGLFIGVYLAQTQQIFKSKANTGINAGLNITSPDGEVKFDGNDIFITPSKNIRINIKNLDELTK